MFAIQTKDRSVTNEALPNKANLFGVLLIYTAVHHQTALIDMILNSVYRIRKMCKETMDLFAAMQS